MAQIFCGSTRNEHAEEPRGDGRSLKTVCIEGKRHEANANMQKFAWDLMLVNEIAIMTVEWYETKR
jgi:hypothetical protein